MRQQLRSSPHAGPVQTLSPYQGRALRLLSDAWFAAQKEGRDVWQFSVEIDALLELGSSPEEDAASGGIFIRRMAGGEALGQLLEILESFRRESDLQQIALLVQQLQDFMDSLEDE